VVKALLFDVRERRSSRPLATWRRSSAAEGQRCADPVSG